jgi:hypothetical protein
MRRWDVYYTEEVQRQKGAEHDPVGFRSELAADTLTDFDPDKVEVEADSLRVEGGALVFTTGDQISLVIGPTAYIDVHDRGVV